MKDIVEFQKLFKVNFPVEEHHQYYTDTLMKSEFYAGIGKMIEEYELYELFAEEEGYKSARSYKLDYALPKLKEYILGTEAYKQLIGQHFEKENKLRTKDKIRNNDGEYLLSVDFKAANYNTLRYYDNKNELYHNWEELLMILDIHPTLAKSKSFRQYVFGNTNPKRLQRVQLIKTLMIVKKLKEDYDIPEEDIVFISHDELVIKLDSNEKIAAGQVIVLNGNIASINKKEHIDMPIHFKVFRNEPIAAGMCVQTVYDAKNSGLSEKHRVLFKVSGNKFFKYFKTHILKEELDKRDLMFMADAEIAVWKVDEDSIAETIIPEGEMSLKEVEKEYPVLVDKLRKEVPSLNDSQIRKIINVTLVLSDELY